MSHKNLDANSVVTAAQKIAQCDFCVTVSRYVTGDNYPWRLEVGETTWSRQLEVQTILDNGDDAVFALLSTEEVDGRRPAVRIITLKQLIADSYIGVKKILHPGA